MLITFVNFAKASSLVASLVSFLASSKANRFVEKSKASATVTEAKPRVINLLFFIIYPVQIKNVIIVKNSKKLFKEEL